VRRLKAPNEGGRGGFLRTAPLSLLPPRCFARGYGQREVSRSLGGCTPPAASPPFGFRTPSFLLYDGT